MSVTAIRLEMDTEQMQKIFGMQDAYIKKLEQDFQVTIVDRNGSVMITGEEENVSKDRPVPVRRIWPWPWRSPLLRTTR